MQIFHRILLWLAIIAGAWLLAKCLSWFLGILRKKLAEKTESKLDDYIIDALRKKPFPHVAILLALVWVVNDAALHFPAGDDHLIAILKQVLAIYGIFLGAVILDGIVNAFLKWSREKTEQKSDTSGVNMFFPMLRKISRIAVFALAAVISLSFLGVDVSALIVSMGVAGAALALATKDTIENAISGILIIIDRPFHIGDRVTLSSGEVCDVFEIGLRSTKFLTLDNNLIIIPNSKLLQDKITNQSYPNSSMRVKVEIGLAYGTDVDKAKAILESIAKEHPTILKNPEPRAYFVEMGDSALKLMLIGRVEKYSDAWNTENQLREKIYQSFAREGIEIAYPQLDVHLKKEK